MYTMPILVRCKHKVDCSRLSLHMHNDLVIQDRLHHHVSCMTWHYRPYFVLNHLMDQVMHCMRRSIKSIPRCLTQVPLIQGRSVVQFIQEFSSVMQFDALIFILNLNNILLGCESYPLFVGYLNFHLYELLCIYILDG